MSGITNSNPPTTDAETPPTPPDRSAFSVANNASAAAIQTPPESGTLFTPIGTMGGTDFFANSTSITTMPPTPALPPHSSNTATASAYAASEGLRTTTDRGLEGVQSMLGCISTRERATRIDHDNDEIETNVLDAIESRLNGPNYTSTIRRDRWPRNNWNWIPSQSDSTFNPSTLSFGASSTSSVDSSVVADSAETNQSIRETVSADHDNFEARDDLFDEESLPELQLYPRVEDELQPIGAMNVGLVLSINERQLDRNLRLGGPYHTMTIRRDRLPRHYY